MVFNINRNKRKCNQNSIHFFGIFENIKKHHAFAINLMIDFKQLKT